MSSGLQTVFHGTVVFHKAYPEVPRVTMKKSKRNINTSMFAKLIHVLYEAYIIAGIWAGRVAEILFPPSRDEKDKKKRVDWFHDAATPGHSRHSCATCGMLGSSHKKIETEHVTDDEV
ncbi:hypothetical protein TNCV_258081 [Trichonephila clavipes]|uniref:Uncharacterized protein n=1 Tax=Trichonephila clavipes TaxID=2585209 RepID=A0A8X6RVW5_TRICX|nr:hypothetical protein TNCV_258081 [Trichonephila clavipes]